MSPREIQRTIGFIVRSQADAVIRMDRWEEEWKERIRVWDEKIQKQIEAVRAENRETAKLVHENTRDIRELRKLAREDRRDIRANTKAIRENTRDIRELKKIVREIAVANRRYERQSRSLDGA